MSLLGSMTLSAGVMFVLSGTLFSLVASNGGTSFADNFVDYITHNWSQTLATLAISYMFALAFTALTSPEVCFKKGTLIETEDGLKPIEEIKEGDLVLAYDEQTGEQAFKPVIQLFRNTTDKWYHITANGEEIICTGEHPFYVIGLGFVPAKNLSVNDKLLTSNNSVVEIDSITVETLSTPETTYNYDNPIKLDFWGNILTDGKVQGGTYVIFKDICKPAEYENLVQKVILKRDLPCRELELDFIPSEDSFYELEDITKHLHLPEKSTVI